MEVLSNYLIPGIAFLLTIVFGFWLSKVGKPYSVALFNVHKLIALGAVIAAGVQVVRLLKSIDLPTALILLLVVVVLCVIALFASGALMSMNKLDYSLMLTIHRIAPVVLVLAVIWAISLIT